MKNLGNNAGYRQGEAPFSSGLGDRSLKKRSKKSLIRQKVEASDPMPSWPPQPKRPANMLKGWDPYTRKQIPNKHLATRLFNIGRYVFLGLTLPCGGYKLYVTGSIHGWSRVAAAS